MDAKVWSSKEGGAWPPEHAPEYKTVTIDISDRVMLLQDINIYHLYENIEINEDPQKNMKIRKRGSKLLLLQSQITCRRLRPVAAFLKF